MTVKVWYKQLCVESAHTLRCRKSLRDHRLIIVHKRHLPWVPSPGSPQLWHHGQCNGQQSFHFCGYQRIAQCSGLQENGKKVKFSSIRRGFDCPGEHVNCSPLEKTGVCPVSCSNTLAARVSLSPLSPTQMFRQSLRMRSSLMGFSFFSLWSCSVEITN